MGHGAHGCSLWVLGQSLTHAGRWQVVSFALSTSSEVRLCGADASWDCSVEAGVTPPHSGLAVLKAGARNIRGRQAGMRDRRG